MWLCLFVCLSQDGRTALDLARKNKHEVVKLLEEFPKRVSVFCVCLRAAKTKEGNKHRNKRKQKQKQNSHNNGDKNMKRSEHSKVSGLFAIGMRVVCVLASCLFISLFVCLVLEWLTHKKRTTCCGLFVCLFVGLFVGLLVCLFVLFVCGCLWLFVVVCGCLFVCFFVFFFILLFVSICLPHLSH